MLAGILRSREDSDLASRPVSTMAAQRPITMAAATDEAPAEAECVLDGVADFFRGMILRHERTLLSENRCSDFFEHLIEIEPFVADRLGEALSADGGEDFGSRHGAPGLPELWT